MRVTILAKLGVLILIALVVAFFAARELQSRWNQDAREEFDALCQANPFVDEGNKKAWRQLRKQIKSEKASQDDLHFSISSTEEPDILPVSGWGKSRRIFNREYDGFLREDKRLTARGLVLINPIGLIHPGLLGPGYMQYECIAEFDGPEANMIEDNLQLSFAR